MNVISFLLLLPAVLLAILVAVFLLEIIAAVMLPQPERPAPSSGDRHQRVVALVPAHDESSGMLPTISDIKAQLHAGDGLLVVADNCSDDTAEVAAAAGAEVIERRDPARIGKGYALDWGLRRLGIDPPDIVVIIDADCRLAEGAIDRLVTACAATGRPIQALYLMTAPEGSQIDYRVAEFAWRVKNWARPLGLRALSLPCQLMGTGMAFPWSVIGSADLANGRIVEDLSLGLDLARGGNPPQFCPSARLFSQFPSSTKGAESQRKRWEQGHLGTIVTTVPRLVYESLANRRFPFLVLTLDMAVPPLTLLGMLIALMLVVSGFAFLFGVSSTALVVSMASLLGYSAAVFTCWLKFGRDILPPGAIRSMASYAVGKLPLYREIISRGGGSQWVRTDRKKTERDT
jgi:cellulose synthase/poly-beta-1,6-N-acetylglucosamine synthase-like glycosyltransferase